jgi:hypothetical protein
MESSKTRGLNRIEWNQVKQGVKQDKMESSKKRGLNRIEWNQVKQGAYTG